MTATDLVFCPQSHPPPAQKIHLQTSVYLFNAKIVQEVQRKTCKEEKNFKKMKNKVGNTQQSTISEYILQHQISICCTLPHVREISVPCETSKK